MTTNATTTTTTRALPLLDTSREPRTTSFFIGRDKTTRTEWRQDGTPRRHRVSQAATRRRLDSARAQERAYWLDDTEEDDALADVL